MTSEPHVLKESLKENSPFPGGESVCAHARAQIASGAGGRFALAGAKSERQLPARYGPAPEVPYVRREARR